MILGEDLRVGDVVYLEWTCGFERVTSKTHHTIVDGVLEIRTHNYSGTLRIHGDQYLKEVGDYPYQ